MTECKISVFCLQTGVSSHELPEDPWEPINPARLLFFKDVEDKILYNTNI